MASGDIPGFSRAQGSSLPVYGDEYDSPSKKAKTDPQTPTKRPSAFQASSKSPIKERRALFPSLSNSPENLAAAAGGIANCDLRGRVTQDLPLSLAPRAKQSRFLALLEPVPAPTGAVSPPIHTPERRSTPLTPEIPFSARSYENSPLRSPGRAFVDSDDAATPAKFPIPRPTPFAPATPRALPDDRLFATSFTTPGSAPSRAAEYGVHDENTAHIRPPEAPSKRRTTVSRVARLAAGEFVDSDDDFTPRSSHVDPAAAAKKALAEDSVYFKARTYISKSEGKCYFKGLEVNFLGNGSYKDVFGNGAVVFKVYSQAMLEENPKHFKTLYIDGVSKDVLIDNIKDWTKHSIEQYKYLQRLGIPCAPILNDPETEGYFKQMKVDPVKIENRDSILDEVVNYFVTVIADHNKGTKVPADVDFSPDNFGIMPDGTIAIHDTREEIESFDCAMGTSISKWQGLSSVLRTKIKAKLAAEGIDTKKMIFLNETY
ncbi:MAG: hypothetical protein HZB76_04720 [Chlamydiae bacterium]|nr:hypothetical protein [Chlamydiota bacterium]